MLANLFRAAARDRDRHLADPDHMRVHPSTLLGRGSHRCARGRGARRTPLATARTGPEGSGDTIALVTADIEGRGVSLIQSLFDGFGAGMLEPDTGVVAAQPAAHASR